jgi:LPS-assembly protein
VCYHNYGNKKGSEKWEVRIKNWEVKNLIIMAKNLTSLFLLLTFSFLLLTSNSFAQKPLHITADHLEYLAQTHTYIAKGSVRIIYGNATLNAEEVHFNELTGDALAIGNVIYEDPEVVLHADKIELNLNTKRGTIYNSRLFFKKRNYHVVSHNIKKPGDKTYLLDDASATTCDAPSPEWHFEGKDVKITLDEEVEARDATFYIKNIPVLYIPYFKAPLGRQTGLLIPSLGHSNTLGFTFKQGFFWAIKDNMDASLYLDYYSKKGIGKGVDYRYILSHETNGELWLYHLRDNDLFRDFFELKSYHNQKLPYNISGFLKVHLVNEFDYYRVLDSTSLNRIGLSSWESDLFGFASEERMQKYLESNLQLSKPFSGGRTYLLSRYRESLEGSSGRIPQSLPEIGFVINTRQMGTGFFNIEVTGTNFWRKDGQQGQRLDIYPNLYLSLGRKINLIQKIGLRETLYFLKDPFKNINRELFDTRTTIKTRFFKRYSSLLHTIEPAIEYVNVPAVDQDDIPEFDSVDFIPRTSNLIYSLTNRFTGSLEIRLRLSQGYNFLDVDEPFSPLRFESSLRSKKLVLNANALYDVYDKNISETITNLTFKTDKWHIGIGKNLRRSTGLDQYIFEIGRYAPIEILGRALPVDISGRLWYDVKGSGVQELNIRSTYTHQCWGLTISFERKPYEYRVMLGIEFKGFGSIRI